MDHRCPACGANLGRRRLTQAVIARMEIDCPRCKNTIRLHVHRAEMIAVLLIFGMIAALAVLAYWFQSRDLVIFALATAMVGTLALPLLERTYLRNWPRYEKTADRQRPLEGK